MYNKYCCRQLHFRIHSQLKVLKLSDSNLFLAKHLFFKICIFQCIQIMFNNKNVILYRNISSVTQIFTSMFPVQITISICLLPEYCQKYKGPTEKAHIIFSAISEPLTHYKTDAGSAHESRSDQVGIRDKALPRLQWQTGLTRLSELTPICFHQ